MPRSLRDPPSWGWPEAAHGALGAAGLALAPCGVGWPLLAFSGSRLLGRAVGAPVPWPVPVVALLDLVLAGVAAAAAAAALASPGPVAAAIALGAPVARGAVAWPHPSPDRGDPHAGRAALAALLWWGPPFGAAAGVALASPGLAGGALVAFAVSWPAGARALARAGSPAAPRRPLALAHRAVGLACAAVVVGGLLRPSPLSPSEPPPADAERGAAVRLGETTATLRAGRVTLGAAPGDGAGALPLPNSAAADALAVSGEGSRRVIHVRAGGRWYRAEVVDGARRDDGPGRRLRAHLGWAGGLALLAWLGAPHAWAAARRARRGTGRWPGSRGPAGARDAGEAQAPGEGR